MVMDMDTTRLKQVACLARLKRGVFGLMTTMKSILLVACMLVFTISSISLGGIISLQI
jgi:hypothetical protein